jgi:hypothetical protein
MNEARELGVLFVSSAGILSLPRTIKYTTCTRRRLGVIEYVGMGVTYCVGADFVLPSLLFLGVDAAVTDVGQSSSRLLESTTIHQRFGECANCMFAFSAQVDC